MVTKMSPERFEEAFPGPFCIRRLERGAHHERKWGWCASFSEAYFTSDSDRLVGDGSPETYPFGWGDTIEDALGALAAHRLREAEQTVSERTKSQHKAECSLADLREKLGGAR
jgi:hypothetical protein